MLKLFLSALALWAAGCITYTPHEYEGAVSTGAAPGGGGPKDGTPQDDRSFEEAGAEEGGAHQEVPHGEPVCGNGVLERGESCDGDCPTSCDDGDACTVDVRTGSAASCDVACAHSPLIVCESGDGCCPDGCDRDSDSDCGAAGELCGNGQRDPGELCDGDCPTSCDDGDACTTQELLGSPDECNAVCVSTPVSACESGDGCCPAPCTNQVDSDCPAPATVGGCDYKAEHGYCVEYRGSGTPAESVRRTCATGGGTLVSSCSTDGLLGRCVLAEGLPQEAVTYLYTDDFTRDDCVEAKGRWY